MSVESSKNPKDIFLAAVEMGSSTEREAFIRHACGDNDVLRHRVEALVTAHVSPDSFLDGDAPDLGADSMLPNTVVDSSVQKADKQIGPYKLLQKVGEGGMGVVYMAEQKSPVKRRVALKVIKPGMDTRQVIARFEAERQALAMMDHPNIAKVFDAGETKNGRPFFVMELVNGISITKFCDDEHLTPRERLELFIPVCEAVQHAHQKGIIHRDLKPSNILVALYDGRPVPKIIDFGVAKATNQQLTEKTMFTQLGQVVGTFEYMSPEQAHRNQLDVDSRSDIYSLGVVLYELLTGDTPFERQRFQKAALDELLRIIREEDPPKPSTRINSSATLPAVASHRRTEPSKLGNLVRGELDWIVMTALEKDRSRRYETAGKLAEDISHYLQDLPVVACPPSRTYLAKKYLARNGRRIFGAACIVTLLAVSMIAGTKWFTEHRKVASTEAKLRVESDQRAIESSARREEEEKRRNEEWLRITALPRIEQFIADGDLGRAFPIVAEARQRFPHDEKVTSFWNQVACRWSAKTTPSGASIFYKQNDSSDTEWIHLGVTPFKSLAVPKEPSFWRIVKDGYEEVVGCTDAADLSLDRRLDPVGQIPKNMVRVATPWLAGRGGDFLIDRFEVTNREFQEFVEANGYQDRRFWKHKFLDGSEEIGFKEAMQRFVDRSSNPGPATWSNGCFPQGEADFPVGGISWYEAAAYAEFRGKKLPTISHWRIASGVEHRSSIVPQSNFGGNGPVEAGSLKSIGTFGTYDMAGNVKEWCWNESRTGNRYCMGGAWSDPDYAFGISNAEPPFARTMQHGLRCVAYPIAPPEEMFARVERPLLDSDREPLSDAQFEIIRGLYDYDALPVNRQLVEVESETNHVHFLGEIDSSYGERIPIHVFIPKSVRPPYQTVIFLPGSYAYSQKKFARNRFNRDVTDALLDSGRAIVWPVCEGTYERRDAKGKPGWATRAYRDMAIRQVKDLRRSVDFLSQQELVDQEALAFWGISTGAIAAPVFLAVESRIKAGIISHGGLYAGKEPMQPEVDPFHFASRVIVPILMINGWNDEVFPQTESQLPLLETLGTSKERKTYRSFDSGHVVPVEAQKREMIEWLDSQFGLPRKPE